MKKVIISFVYLFLFCGLAFAQEDKECNEFIEKLKKDPSAGPYGWVDVLEDWSSKEDPNAKKIKVFYYTFHMNPNSNVVPMVYFYGGPGGNGHGIHEYFEGLATNPKSSEKMQRIGEYYKQIPIIYIDQRGDGCSTHLPKVELNKNKRIKSAQKFIDQIALYGPRSIVMDTETVRKKLGLKSIRIFGQSYGSMIVHRYLELAPDHVTAAFAHGAAIMENGIEWTKMRVRAFKRVGDLYFLKYPEDRALIKRAQEIFPKDFCSETQFKICGAPLLDDLGWASLSYYGGWAGLHEQIRSLFLPEKGDLPKDPKDLQLNMAFLKEHFQSRANDSDWSHELLVDVVPARETPGGQCNTWSCEIAIREMEAAGEKPMEYEFNECRNQLAIQRNFNYNLIKKEVKKDYPSLTTIAQNIENLRIKFYLYSGEVDTFGPQETFAEEAALFGSIVTYRKFPAPSGHNWVGEEQLWQDIISTQTIVKE